MYNDMYVNKFLNASNLVMLSFRGLEGVKVNGELTTWQQMLCITTTYVGTTCR